MLMILFILQAIPEYWLGTVVANDNPQAQRRVSLSETVQIRVQIENQKTKRHAQPNQQTGTRHQKKTTTPTA
jgi:hypothetical protein